MLKTRYTKILEEAGRVLLIRGYSETLLHSFDAPGSGMKLLQANLQLAIIDSLWRFQLTDVLTRMTGMFTAQKHTVSFHFRYQYDPDNIRLSLLDLRADLHGLAVVIPVGGHPLRNLPSANEVYNRLIKTEKRMEKQSIAVTEASDAARRSRSL